MGKIQMSQKELKTFRLGMEVVEGKLTIVDSLDKKKGRVFEKPFPR